jgi:hypothetical protein
MQQQMDNSATINQITLYVNTDAVQNTLENCQRTNQYSNKDLMTMILLLQEHCVMRPENP